MGNTGTGLSSRYGSTAGVGKQVQHLDRTASLLYQVREPVPVHSLFREKTGMLEAEGL